MSESADAILSADRDFVEMAEAEVAQAMSGARLLARLDEAGWDSAVLLYTLPASYWELAARWHERPPIFIRHLNPVQVHHPLPEGPNAVHALRATAVDAFADLMDPTLPFSIQTRILTDVGYGPYDVNRALSRALAAATGASLDVRHPRQVVSVVIARHQGQLAGFLGLSPAAYNLSDWAGGRRRFAREKGQISRSEFKLLEALEIFDIPLPSRGVALDLGAAPGGWTRVLRQKEQYVTAVDPAELAPGLQTDPNVRHLPMTPEEYLATESEKFDLIVNGMRRDARDSARLMVDYAPRLYRDGRALMTLKLPEQNRENVIDHTLNILRDAYEILGARQLFHNRSEITVYLKRKERS